MIKFIKRVLGFPSVSRDAIEAYHRMYSTPADPNLVWYDRDELATCGIECGDDK